MNVKDKRENLSHLCCVLQFSKPNKFCAIKGEAVF